LLISESRKTSFIVIDKDKCKACHYCISFCPRDIIGTSKEINRLGYNYAAVIADKAHECTGAIMRNHSPYRHFSLPLPHIRKYDILTNLPSRSRSMPEKTLMGGNIAIGEGALLAGCQAYFGYPITPQNDLLELMARRMPELGRVFLQTESELAAINMVYGALR
jgi:TPP-dependent indolepyruvate ferredoxin oxidoreductase alpha subunit